MALPCGAGLWRLTHCEQYLNAIWNVINFKEAEKRLLDATQ